MVISLIGMSGAGKSFWTKKLEEKGFKSYSIDELIESKLEKELIKLGHSGLNGVGQWMGQPFEDQYKKTSQTYLSLEEESLQSVLKLIEKESKNIVIDTTGSLIYLNKNILNKLAKLAKIIYLKVTPEAIEKQYKLYLQDPKPVIWGDIFNKKRGEENLEALARCYPLLLQYRASRYEKLADITLDVTMLKDPAFTTEKFISKIKTHEKK